VLSLVAVQNRKLEYKQQVLEQEIADMQEAFDSALSLLRREKLNLEADVKAAQIKRLTYQQELQLLKVGNNIYEKEQQTIQNEQQIIHKNVGASRPEAR